MKSKLSRMYTKNDILFNHLFFSTQIFTFLLLFFAGSWHHGIEVTRYFLAFFVVWHILQNHENRQKLLSFREFQYLILFFLVVCIGFLSSNKGIDRVLNWLLVFASGFFAAQSLTGTPKWLLAALPLGLTSFFAVVVIFKQSGYLPIDFLAPTRISLFYNDDGAANRLFVVAASAAYSSLAMIFDKQSKHYINIFFSILIVFIFYIMIRTGSRGGFAGFIASSCVLTFLIYRQSFIKSLAFISLLSIMFFLIINIPSSTQCLTRCTKSFQSFDNMMSSLADRDFIWKTAIDSFIKNPLIGNGLVSFKKTYEEAYRDASKQPDSEKQNTRSYSS